MTEDMEDMSRQAMGPAAGNQPRPSGVATHRAILALLAITVIVDAFLMLQVISLSDFTTTALTDIGARIEETGRASAGLNGKKTPQPAPTPKHFSDGENGVEFDVPEGYAVFTDTEFLGKGVKEYRLYRTKDALAVRSFAVTLRQGSPFGEYLSKPYSSYGEYVRVSVDGKPAAQFSDSFQGTNDSKFTVIDDAERDRTVWIVYGTLDQYRQPLKDDPSGAAAALIQSIRLHDANTEPMERPSGPQD